MLLAILIPVSIVTVTGLLAGLVLSVASKIFAVEVDETTQKLRDVLPGANCGSCGCAGCDEYAAKLSTGEVEPNLCTVGGADVAKKIGEIMGVEVGAIESKHAVVKCKGHLSTSEYIMDFEGPQSCSVAKLFYNGRTSCNYACLGYGDCANACQYDAIHIINYIATVDDNMCIGCGACSKACPNGILEIIPRDQKIFVACSNRDKGADTRKICSNGCIGCKKCEKVCEFGAITVENNCAHIDYEKCTRCGKCAEGCPVKCIEIMG